MGFFSILLMSAALLIFLVPIIVKGSSAFVFQDTVEFRKFVLRKFGRGNAREIKAELAKAAAARQPIYDMIHKFENPPSFLEKLEVKRRYGQKLAKLKERLRTLLGPFPGETGPPILRDQYGQTRWDRAQVKLNDILYKVEYDHSDPTKMGVKMLVTREKDFEGTSLAPLFPYLKKNLRKMLLPRWKFYWRFLFDRSYDSHIFGGIWPEFLGTLYLTVGAMLFAIPMGVLTAVYLVEYAGDSKLVSLIRICINTLAGVPSIVFGLFGLAFFINTLHVSNSKSVLAGALTLAFLVLPTVIRATEEAIKAVPRTYKEASLSLGASKWYTIATVILPAALPGILTGIIISMGRAAGETAPIIFTAAVSVGRPLSLWQTLNEPTLALPWGIYNLCTEHQSVDEIRHVQFGMVLTLIMIVLMLNAVAIWLRARVSRKLKG